MKKQKVSQDLFSIRFKNLVSNRTLRARVTQPQLIEHFSELTGTKLEHLESRLVIFRDGRRTSEVVGGATWLEIVILALERLRQQIPTAEETQWVDERGVASWVILPKTIPIGWGYKVYQQIVASVDKKIVTITAGIERKRRAHQAKKNLSNKKSPTTTSAKGS